MAAKMQESEAGDGTNLVISLAGEMMVQAEALLQMGLHPSEILIGYEKSANKVHELLESLVSYTVQDIRNKEEVVKAIRSCISSKQYGNEDFISGLIADSCLYALPKTSKSFNVDHVRVQKILGGALKDSEVVHGMVVQRSSETSVHHVTNAKVAVFNTPFEQNQGETKGTILLHNAEELLTYTKTEEDNMENFVKGLADVGITVCVVSGSVSEVALHFFEKYKIMCLKIMSKFELKRIAAACGSICCVKMATPTPEEIGFAQEVSMIEISSTRCTVIKRDEVENKYSTIIIRGATYQTLDDIERAIDDGVNTFKTLVRDGRMLAGAGATEIHIAHQIQEFAKTQPGLDQYAIERFGQAFEVIPRTLADNAGYKAEEILAKLYSETSKSSKMGIDIVDGEVKDSVEANILDSFETKSWAIKLCLDAVMTILKVDQIIMSKPAGGPKNRPAPNPHGDD